MLCCFQRRVEFREFFLCLEEDFLDCSEDVLVVLISFWLCLDASLPFLLSCNALLELTAALLYGFEQCPFRYIGFKVCFTGDF